MSKRETHTEKLCHRRNSYVGRVGHNNSQHAKTDVHMWAKVTRRDEGGKV